MSSVLSGLQRFQRHCAAIPEHIKTAVNPDLYTLALKEIAEFELKESGMNDQEVAEMVATVKGEYTSEGMSFRMFSTENNRPGITILEWVEKYKIKREPRDFYQADSPFGTWVAGQVKPPEIIAGNIERAALREGMLPPPGGGLMPLPKSFQRDDLPGHGALNPTGLIAMVDRTGISAQVLHEALMRVLEKWGTHLRKELCSSIKQRIRNAFID